MFIYIMLKNNGREKKGNSYEGEPVTCPFCGCKFHPTEDDIEKIDNTILYYCRGCGDEFHKDLKIK